MSNGDLGWITNFIWGIADDVLRDLYVRGKYRDVILPMTVLRRLDAILEPTKKAVTDMKASLDAKKIVHRDVEVRGQSHLKLDWVEHHKGFLLAVWLLEIDYGENSGDSVRRQSYAVL